MITIFDNSGNAIGHIEKEPHSQTWFAETIKDYEPLKETIFLNKNNAINWIKDEYSKINR